MVKKRLIAFILIFLFSFTACGQIKAIKDKIFGGDKKEEVSKKEKTKKKEEAKKEKPKEEKPKEEKTKEEPAEEKKEEKKPEDKEKKVPEAPPEVPPVPKKEPSPEKKEVKTPLAPPEVKPGKIPLISTDHFGGMAQSFSLDDQLLYLGFGQKLVFYDNALDVRGFVNLESPVQKVVTQKTAEGITLYVKEKGDVLEIVQLSKEGSPKILKSFEVDGPFDIVLGRPLLPSSGSKEEPASPRLFVYLPQKVQILDLRDLTQVKVIAELPLPGVSQMIALDDYFYAVHRTSLNVIDSQNLSTRASIPVGTKFRILGEKTEGDRSFLVLALQSSRNKKWHLLQFMPLVSGGGGISDLGQGIAIKPEADEIIVDWDQPYLYFLRSGNLSLFSLKRRIELASENETAIKDINLVQGGGGVVFAVSEGKFGRFEYQLAGEAEPKPETGKRDKKAREEALKVPDIPALADVPAEEKKKPDFEWVKEKITRFPGRVHQVLLPGSNSVLLVNGLSSKEALAPPFYFSKTFSTDTANLSPLNLSKGDKRQFSLFKVTDYGILAYDQLSGKIALIKKDFSSIEEIKLAGQPLVGMDTALDKGDYLYLAVTKKEDKGEVALVAYKVESAKLVKKVGSLSFEEIGGIKIYNGGQKALVACGTQGVCVVDIGTGRAKPALLSSIPTSQKEAITLEVAVSPREKMAYAFSKNKGAAFISIINISADPPAEVAVIPNVSMTREQFRGLTYSAGGRRLLLPQERGLVVYDVKDPKKPTREFTWPIGRAFYADVINRGKTVCVALGKKGVECGNFE